MSRREDRERVSMRQKESRGSSRESREHERGVCGGPGWAGALRQKERGRSNRQRSERCGRAEEALRQKERRTGNRESGGQVSHDVS